MPHEFFDPTGFWPSVWLDDNRHLITVDAGKLFLLDNETMAAREIFAPSVGRTSFPTISKDNRTLLFSARHS